MHPIALYLTGPENFVILKAVTQQYFLGNFYNNFCIVNMLLYPVVSFVSLRSKTMNCCVAVINYVFNLSLYECLCVLIYNCVTTNVYLLSFCSL